MIKNKLLYRMLCWRFSKTSKIYKKHLKLYDEATSEKKQMKHLARLIAITNERIWLQRHMHPELYK